MTLWICLAVGSLWGCTNPFLRRAGGDSLKTCTTTQSSTENQSPRKCSLSKLRWVENFIRQTCALFVNWQFLLPFCLNQLGSALFVVALGIADLSVVVVLCNGLTFVFTAATSYLLGEPSITLRELLSNFNCRCYR